MKQFRVERGGQAPGRETEAQKLENMNYQYMCAKRDGKNFTIPKGYHLNEFGVIVKVTPQGNKKSNPVPMTPKEADWQKEMRNDNRIIGSVIPGR